MLMIVKNGIWPWLFDHSDDIGVFLRLGGNDLIRWYAVCILTGFLLCLWRAHIELKRHGYPADFYDNFLFSVLPIAILGGRIWYIVSEPSSFIKDTAWESFLSMVGYTPGHGFALSGLAVQGAVIFGVAWGIFYFTKIKPQIKVGFHYDLIIPSILIGQVVGRWGNFFNGEVYGKVVSRSSLWFIPKFAIDYCTGTGADSQLGLSEVHIPLFYIESLINLVGFILLAFVLWRYWTKGRKPFQLGSLYFVWYGTVRLLLEPLRMDEYIMQREIFGLHVRTSILMSILYIAFGVISFVVFGIIYRHKTLEEGYRNDKYEAKQAAIKEAKDKELNEKIEAKKAEIRARKAKEQNNE